MAKKYLYSTIRRGKVKVISEKQHALLEARKLAHTDVYMSKSGKKYKKRKFNKK